MPRFEARYDYVYTSNLRVTHTLRLAGLPARTSVPSAVHPSDHLPQGIRFEV